MTTKEFRQTAEYVSALRRIFDDPYLKLWLEAMDSETPAGRVAPRGFPAHDICVMQGEASGWQNYRDRFRLGILPAPPDDQADAGPQDYSVGRDEFEEDQRSKKGAR